VVTFRWTGPDDDAVAPALEAVSVLEHEVVLGTVDGRLAWAGLLERLDGRAPPTRRGAVRPGLPLAEAFRAFVRDASDDAPFDHEVLRRAPGAQLLMLERLEDVAIARLAGRRIAIARHARAGFVVFSTDEGVAPAKPAPGPPRDDGPARRESSTVAAAVKAALVAFDAPARIGFGATREAAIAAWLRACGVVPSAPPRLGAGPSFAADEAALASGRAIAIDADERIVVAWARSEGDAWRATIVKSTRLAHDPPSRRDAEESLRARIRARLETRMPWREEGATCLVVPWWELPPDVAASLGDRDCVAWRIHDEDVTWFALREGSSVETFTEDGAWCGAFTWDGERLL
jgi:hypothetical protein